MNGETTKPLFHAKLRWMVKAAILTLALLWVVTYFNIVPPLIPKFGTNYQAVFLSNGQVYFGKLYRETSNYAVLREVYYLQLAQAPQPAAGTPQVNINLVKLGAELHGPKDEMRINRSHILFVEDLRADSQVVQAIKQLKGAK